MRAIYETGGYELAIFRPTTICISHRICADSMGISSFKFLWWAPKDAYQNQRPWMTLDRLTFNALLHYTCISEPITKIPYYQWQKCSLGMTVSRKIRFMRRLVEKRGLQMRVGLSKMAIFTYFISPGISFEPLHLRHLSFILCYVVSSSSMTPK